MAKDTYYFSHDYNARNDRKIAALVRDYKSSGYGIFWATCEIMHEENGSVEFDEITINSIAKDMNESPELISEVLNKCVDKYRLFTKQTKQNEAENFASLLQSGRIIRNLDSKNEKKEIKAESGRLGGIKSGESRRNKNLLKQNEADGSTASSNEAKERKGNEIKVIQDTHFWFLRFYHSNYETYKSVFNGQSTTEDYFIEWKSFIDFIYEKKLEAIFECKFLSPHDYGKLVTEEHFSKSLWEVVLKEILATGIKPEHNLFFRIPQFMKYGKKTSHSLDKKNINSFV